MATIAEQFDKDLSDFVNRKIKEKEVSHKGLAWYKIKRDKTVEVWIWEPELIWEILPVVYKYMVEGSRSDRFDGKKTIYHFRIQTD
jgi:hypothetical protein